MENKKYFVGLDIGTDSLGYAATDTEYTLLKHKGEPMWGTHLFDGAESAEDRRSFRAGRRRLDRRQQRVLLIQELFAKEIAKTDVGFFERIRQSSLISSDKTCPSGLFSDDAMTDKTYNGRYPTIHHLLFELISDPSKHDVRPVYLACAWLVAHRGHFLSNVSNDNVKDLTDFESLYDNFIKFFDEKPWDVDPEKIRKIMADGRNITARKKGLQNLLFEGKKPERDDGFPYGKMAMITLLAGGQCDRSELFPFMQDDADQKISMSMDDEEYGKLLSELQDDAELIIRIKALVDCVELKKLMGKSKYISEQKIGIYEKHKADLKYLKAFIKKYCPEKYKNIFANCNSKLQ